MSVSFTGGDGSEYAEGYFREETQIGAVYVPLHGVLLEENAAIRYEKYPWIEKFELFSSGKCHMGIEYCSEINKRKRSTVFEVIFAKGAMRTASRGSESRCVSG